MIQDKLKKYKKMITPKDYSYDDMYNFLRGSYNIVDITDTYKNSILYTYTLENISHSIFKNSNIVPAVFEIINDKQSKYLFHDFEEDDINKMFVFIDKNTGYIETNSNELFYKLTIIRGVSKKDYDSESDILLNLLSTMYLHDERE